MRIKFKHPIHNSAECLGRVSTTSEISKDVETYSETILENPKRFSSYRMGPFLISGPYSRESKGWFVELPTRKGDKFKSKNIDQFDSEAAARAFCESQLIQEELATGQKPPRA